MKPTLILALALLSVSPACTEDEPETVNPPPVEGSEPEEVVPPPVLPPEPVSEPGSPEDMPSEPVVEQPAVEEPPVRKPAVVKPADVPAEPKKVDAAAQEARLNALLEQLDSEKQGERFSAAVELGRLGRTDAIDRLAEVLAGDTDYFVRRAAARSLGELEDDRAVPSLIDALDDPELFVRMSVMQSLKRITGHDYKTVEEWKAWDRKR
jgi:hypothetical protein